MMYDILIRNVRVADGTGNPIYHADVAVKDGKIAKIGYNLTAGAEKIIDGTGKVLAPGFIDTHSHLDKRIEAVPHCAHVLKQCVTTVIGVVPASAFTRTQTGSGVDLYKLGNSYTKRVLEAGAIPVAVTPVDNWVPEEALKLYDGYIVQGGAEFYPYHFQIVHDAVVNHKRYLGICLGSQLLYAYFAMRKMVEEQGYEGDLVKAICALIDKKGPDFSVLEKVDGHYSSPTTLGNEDMAKHDVHVVPNTILHRLVGREQIRAQSFHHLQVPPTQELVTINAWSAKGDGVVEGVEYGDNLLGIQSHPEADALLPEIFTFLTEDVSCE